MKSGSNLKDFGERPNCPRCGTPNPKSCGKYFWGCRGCGRRFSKNPVIKKPVDLSHLDEWWLGYLSGIIDGEGSLDCHKAKTKKQRRGFYYRFRTRIGNTNKALVNAINKAIPTAYTKLEERDDKHKDKYEIRLSHQLSKQLLPKLTLIAKPKQKKLLLEGIKLLEEHWGNATRGHTPNDPRLEEIYLEMKELNRKGKWDATDISD